jgi:tRNA G18 (ribose-2'-O)-methylase SpoU
LKTPVAQIRGVPAIEAALERAAPVRLVLIPNQNASAAAVALAAEARDAGIEVREIGETALRRYSQDEPGVEALALVSERPEASVDAILRAGGAAWLLAGIGYPGNAGFAIRAAEVSGAAGIILDADFDHVGRREAVRASMRADWFMPVCWASAQEALDRARELGHAIVGIEDSGSAAPWEIDLTGAVLFVVGGERHGTPASVLERCDAVARIPMAGFIPSYNLQAAVAVLAAERLRQLGIR